MSTPKRVAWKDIVAPPLNWKAPKMSDQGSESSQDKQDKEEQSADK
ncbi:hypothetical protein ABRZ04_01925 [Castellaniella ginsengisoli]|uniref:Uncharacterized protein n=1 Tax=Castellaniella ginsengisoli TaxID=546114 RepID=A0AB39D0L1_9BURK